MSSGEQGWKGEGGVIVSKEVPKRPAQIPAPKDVLLLSGFPPVNSRVMSPLLSALTHTPHYCLTLGMGLHALCHCQEDHFSELIELNIPSDSW